MKKLAIVSSRIPWPLDKGDKLRLYNQMRSLSTDFEIHLISLTDNFKPEDDLGDLLSYCHSIKTFKLLHHRSRWNMLRSLFSSRPLQVAYFYDREIAMDLAFHLLELQPDIIYCQLVRMSEYIPQGYAAMIDYMDAGGLNDLASTYQRNWLSRLVLSRETDKLKKYETSVAPRFQKHSIISARDQHALDVKIQELCQIIPNGVEVPDPTVAQSTTNRKIGFFGNMSYRHNQIAVDYIIDNLLPMIAVDDLQIELAGAGEYLRLSNTYDQLTFQGYVPDLEEFLSELDIIIVPIFSGSGIQNKVLEAMAHGIPVITTSFVNASISAPTDSLIVADDAESFTTAIKKLISQPDLRFQIGQAGKAYVQRSHNWDVINRQLSQILTELTKHE